MRKITKMFKSVSDKIYNKHPLNFAGWPAIFSDSCDTQNLQKGERISTRFKQRKDVLSIISN